MLCSAKEIRGCVIEPPTNDIHLEKLHHILNIQSIRGMRVATETTTGITMAEYRRGSSLSCFTLGPGLFGALLRSSNSARVGPSLLTSTNKSFSSAALK